MDDQDLEEFLENISLDELFEYIISNYSKGEVREILAYMGIYTIDKQKFERSKQKIIDLVDELGD